MEAHERERLAIKLLSGITFFIFEEKRYKIINPTPEQLLLAEEIALEDSVRVSFKQLLSEEEAKEYLHNKGIWTYQDEEAMEEAEKTLEDLKEALFKSLFNKKAQDSIRRKIKGIKGSIMEGFSRKYSISSMTLEFHRKDIKNQFLAAVCTFDEDNKRLYTEKGFGTTDSTLMEKAHEARENDIITQEQMRDIARSEPWRSYWMVSKQNLFGNPSLNLFGPTQSEAVIIPSSHLNPYQRAMVGVCKMYDNAAQHPDCPDDEVLDEHDMFDGWMIFENRKREKEKKKKRIDEIADQKGDELFVFAETHEEGQEIYDVNDDTEKMRLKGRFQQIKSSETPLDEADLLDVKIQLRNQMMEQVRGQSR
jgi:hypothetical protein